jgi:hypothetical protein
MPLACVLMMTLIMSGFAQWRINAKEGFKSALKRFLMAHK